MLIAWLFVGLACDTPRTEVLVRVYGDLEVQHKLSSLTITVWSERDGRWQERLDGAPTKRAELVWPVEVGVLRKGTREGRFEVVASAYDADGALLVSDRALVRFADESTRVLRLDLRSQCMRRNDCGSPSCHGESCQVCRAEGDGALCVKSEERATEPFTRANHARTQDAPPAMNDPVVTPVEGEPCDDDGARVCAARASRERLACTDGRWQELATCAEDEVCDARPGEKQGTCAPRCDRPAGHGSYCARPNQVGHCSEDGALLSTETCRPGLTCVASDDDHAQCSDIDECLREPELCTPGACVNTEGSYRCQCLPGSVGEHFCTAKDECEFDDTCGGGWCERPDVGFGYLCICPQGFEHRDQTCFEVDECARGNPCAAGCANTPSSFSCQCGADTWCDQAYACRTSEQGALCVGELADWPMPNTEPGAPNQAAYKDAGNGTLEDLVTGLIWQTEPSEGRWPDARAHCEQLTLAGQEDWRLPTTIELISILDYRHQGPACDVRFRGAPKRWEWSSGSTSFDFTVVTTAPALVDFHEGKYVLPRQIQVAPWDEDIYPFRCVRGPAKVGLPRASRYELVGPASELLADRSTRLMWARVPSELLPWEAALAYCADLSVAGHEDFRLPTVKELQTLWDPEPDDFGRSQLILGDPYATSWSSTTVDATHAWSLAWSGRYLDAVSTRSEADALCVRQLD
jgi:hypothetical protein